MSFSAFSPGSEFVWFENFAEVLWDERFWLAGMRSLLFAGASTALSFLIGFGLAFLMREKFRGHAFFYMIFIIPMLVVPVVIGYTFEMLLVQKGPLNGVLSLFWPKEVMITWLAQDVRLDTDAPGLTASRFPDLCIEGSNVYVVWQDGLSFGSPNIHFNRSTDFGNTWLPDDVQLNTAPGAPSGAPQDRPRPKAGLLFSTSGAGAGGARGPGRSGAAARSRSPARTRNRVPGPPPGPRQRRRPC